MSDVIEAPRCVRAFGAGSTQVRIWSNGMVTYRYALGDDGTAEFTLFSEVGEPHKTEFMRIFRVFSVVVLEGGIEFNTAPWVADKLVSCVG
jgi:hypothetical protein